MSAAELQGDREVTVRVPDAYREKIRQRPHHELVTTAEKTRERVALQKNSAPLGGGVRIEAIRKLPSGDVCVRANSAAGADILRRHQGWTKAFGQGARIQQPSWGFVASGVPVRDVNLTSDEMAATARELQRQNASTWGGEKAQITHLSWLTRAREGQFTAKLVIEVDNNHWVPDLRRALTICWSLSFLVWTIKVAKNARFHIDRHCPICPRPALYAEPGLYQLSGALQQ